MLLCALPELPTLQGREGYPRQNPQILNYLKSLQNTHRLWSDDKFLTVRSLPINKGTPTYTIGVSPGVTIMQQFRKS